MECVYIYTENAYFTLHTAPVRQISRQQWSGLTVTVQNVTTHPHSTQKQRPIRT